MQPAVVDAIVRFVAQEPGLVLIVGVLLAFVFFAYLFVRRTLLSLRDGYDEAREGRRR